jgi:hypothetical protein
MRTEAAGSTASSTSNSGSGNELCTISIGWLTTPT